MRWELAQHAGAVGGYSDGTRALWTLRARSTHQILTSGSFPGLCPHSPLKFQTETCFGEVWRSVFSSSEPCLMNLNSKPRFLDPMVSNESDTDLENDKAKWEVL